jgi:hypothetical protein
MAKSSAQQAVFSQTMAHVVAEPIITSFNADPNPALFGGTSKLTGVFSNGTGIIDKGVGTVTSGAPADSPEMTTPITYTLTVTNPAGEGTNKQLSVAIQTVAVSQISPSANVMVGTTKQFSATVTGAADSTVDWSSTCGTISSVGMFTAPAQVEPCEITATSHAKQDVFSKKAVAIMLAGFCTGKPDFTSCSNSGAEYEYNICMDQICTMPGCGDASCNPPGPNFPVTLTTGSHFMRDTTHAGQPVVHDTITGLEWQGCTAGYTGDNCGTGNVQTMTWLVALNYCNTLDWGGKTNWRLPDIDELISIIDFGLFNPAIDAVFPNTPSALNQSFFWSISTHINDIVYAWTVTFWDGYWGKGLNNEALKTIPNLVRCVTGEGVGPQIQTRFEKSIPVFNQPIVFDKVTKLTWQGCATGLFGSDCKQGTVALKNWSDAQICCTDLNWGGFSTGWRLPDIKELSTLIDRRRSAPAIDTTMFPDSLSTYFRSVTIDSHYPSNAWLILFDDGSARIQGSFKSSTTHFRCVRSPDQPDAGTDSGSDGGVVGDGGGD